MATLTDAELDELERLEREATPGEWGRIETSAGWSWVVSRRHHHGMAVPLFEIRPPSPREMAQREKDAEFIADSRNALPRLLAEVREARARIAALEKERDGERQGREAAERERNEAYALVYGGHPPSFPDRLNELPAWARQYIGQIETNADPAGTVRSVAELRENCAGLVLTLKAVESRAEKAEGECGWWRSGAEALLHGNLDHIRAIISASKDHGGIGEAFHLELIQRRHRAEAAERDAEALRSALRSIESETYTEDGLSFEKVHTIALRALAGGAGTKGER